MESIKRKDILSPGVTQGAKRAKPEETDDVSACLKGIVDKIVRDKAGA